ncbi:MAG: 5-keto-4-deoxy-D-glucarate aldolase [Cyclobacteriaceae bacterium]|nr:MAG: 5-keto-4-deoxy-D-glucarate aldolase [Cyclobacteriaceae bacterium]
MKTLKDRLKAGEVVHGCWLNSGSAHDAEIVGKAGFDWINIDLEHGVSMESDLPGQLQALETSSATPIVRVESLIQSRVSRALDLGAQGIIFPMIRSLTEAQQAASFMRYPPNGVRGMATQTRAVGFGLDFEDYYLQEERRLLGILQVENSGILNDLEEIAQLDAIDILFVGPADLTLSLGIFRQYNHPAFLEAIKKVQQAAKKHRKSAGVLIPDMGEYEKYYNLGYRFIGCGSDTVFLLQGAQKMAEDLKNKLHT